ncbi:MAG: hypothetical protein JHC87_05150 [Thermoleophilaceae bacterium]|nr:hypothetical protein [Thermoleophilaceae bacterium]
MENLSRGRLLCGIGGVLLLISLFLSWYGVDLGPVSAIAQQYLAGVDTSINAWQAFDIADLFMFLVAIAAIAPAALDIAGMELELPIPFSNITLAGGGLTILYIVYRILDKPNGAGLKFGILIGLISAGLVTFGSWQQMNEESAAPSGTSGAPPMPPPAAPPAASPMA